MSTRQVDVRLMADVQSFVKAMTRIVIGMKPYLDARQARIRRMHSAYSRRRGRGRW